MRRYIPAVYLSTIWLTWNFAIEVGVFNRVPLYIILTVLMFLFLSLDVLKITIVLAIIMLFYETLKLIQPDFFFTIKGFFGILAFSCIMPVTYFSLTSIKKYSAKEIGVWLRIVLLTIALPIVAENIFGIFELVPSKGENYIFPIPVYSGLFNEPSHVGLALTPFVFILGYKFSQFKKYLGTSSIVALVVTIGLCPSGTLISVIVIAGTVALALRIKRGEVAGTVIGALIIVVFGGMLVEIPDLLDRLNGVIFPNEHAAEWALNFSALAFLKGRQMAEYSIVHFPLGVAFLDMQRLVPFTTVSYLTDLLFVLNSDDGASLLFKGICEFGILFIVFMTISAIRFLRNVFGSEKKLFYDIVVLSFEFVVFANFIRGASYFSGVVAIGLSATIFGSVLALKHRVPYFPYIRATRRPADYQGSISILDEEKRAITPP